MRKYWKTVSVLAIAAGFSASAAYAAAPTEMITNGDFETGTFFGWTILDSGSGGTSINDGTFVPPGPGGALPPIGGAFDGKTWQGGPGLHMFRQSFIVPSDIHSAALRWDDRVQNHAGIFSDPNQEWRVVIRDVGGTIIHESYSTSPGDPLIQLGPNSRADDITAVLQANVGALLTVSFEEQDNLSFFNATLDNVSLLVSQLPTDKDECKNGGWETFVNVNTGEQIFKNQGDCVSFVATKGKNLPANY
jgi:hypothetical protein